MTNESDSADPVDGFDLGDYRYAVAKYVKLLIRARATAEPDFLSDEQYERWNLGDISDDTYGIEQLLQLAAAAHDHLWREFIGPHGSGGVAADDPRAELKQSVVKFTTGTPPAELLEQLRGGSEIDWASVAEWDLLDAIRKGLDELPEAQAGPASEKSDCPVLVVDPRARDVEVLGVPLQLTQPQLNVIQALIDTYPHTLSKEQLVSRGGHSDARGILQRLAKKEHWRRVIKLAGEPGGGYGLAQPSTE